MPLRARHWLRALILILNPHVRLVLLCLPRVKNQVLKGNSLTRSCSTSKRHSQDSNLSAFDCKPVLVLHRYNWHSDTKNKWVQCIPFLCNVLLWKNVLYVVPKGHATTANSTEWLQRKVLLHVTPLPHAPSWLFLLSEACILDNSNSSPFLSTYYIPETGCNTLQR